MAVTRSTADPTRLSCGRDVDTVWEHLDRPLDEHERTCLACRAARASLAPLAAATRDLSSADREDPELRGSSTVLAEVMAIARREVRRGRTLPLDRDDPDLAVSEYAIAAVVRTAARSPIHTATATIGTSSGATTRICRTVNHVRPTGDRSPMIPPTESPAAATSAEFP